MEGLGQLFPTRVEVQKKKGERKEVVESGFEFPRKEHCPQSLYDDQLKYFIECIEQHETPVPGGMEGWMNMKVVDAAYESANTGKVVEIR
jgi:predicted dehydrogenase